MKDSPEIPPMSDKTTPAIDTYGQTYVPMQLLDEAKAEIERLRVALQAAEKTYVIQREYEELNTKLEARIEELGVALQEKELEIKELNRFLESHNLLNLWDYRKKD